jgi:hypothetical protein
MFKQKSIPVISRLYSGRIMKPSHLHLSVHSLWMLELHLHSAIRLHGGYRDVFTWFTLTRPLIRFLYITSRQIIFGSHCHLAYPSVTIRTACCMVTEQWQNSNSSTFKAVQLPVLALPPKPHINWDCHEQFCFSLGRSGRSVYPSPHRQLVIGCAVFRKPLPPVSKQVLILD